MTSIKKGLTVTVIDKGIEDELHKKIWENRGCLSLDFMLDTEI